MVAVASRFGQCYQTCIYMDRQWPCHRQFQLSSDRHLSRQTIPMVGGNNLSDNSTKITMCVGLYLYIYMRKLIFFLQEVIPTSFSKSLFHFNSGPHARPTLSPLTDSFTGEIRPDSAIPSQHASPSSSQHAPGSKRCILGKVVPPSWDITTCVEIG